MSRLRAARASRYAAVLATAALCAVLFSGAGQRAGAEVIAPGAAPQEVAAGATSTATSPAGSRGPDATSKSSTTVPGGIKVGPSGATTTTVAKGGTVSGGGQSSSGLLGLFDVTGDIESAIEAALDDWFRDVVTDALDPALTLLGDTLLATPDVTGQSRVVELWQDSVGIADSFLVLFVLAAGAIVMGHETVQTRTALKDVLPRIVLAAVALNASLSVAGLAISTANSLSEAFLGQGVGPAQAAVVLQQVVLGSLANQGIFVVLLGGVVAVLVVLLLATYVVRVALVVVLVVAAPVALLCHALPQTEGLARLWWRAFFGALAVQVAQSLVLITALQVFLATGGPANLGINSTGGLVDMVVSACLCWVLVKIPGWVSRAVFSGAAATAARGAWCATSSFTRLSRPRPPRSPHDQGARCGTGAHPRRRRARGPHPGRPDRPPARDPGYRCPGPVGGLLRHTPPGTAGRLRCAGATRCCGGRGPGLGALRGYGGRPLAGRRLAAPPFASSAHPCPRAAPGPPSVPRPDRSSPRCAVAALRRRGRRRHRRACADGKALVCRASAVTFSLRSPGEQEALVAAFGRWLNSLSAPVQVLVRAEPVDLGPAIAQLLEAAPGLPHPALESAARGHARFLADLAASHDLLRRDVLVVLREPAGPMPPEGSPVGPAKPSPPLVPPG